MTPICELVASSVIGTPLQRPAEAIRSLIALRRRWKSPESREILLEYERTRTILRRVVAPEMNCIDVGCHLGSVLGSIVTLAPRGRHIAIEPLPYKAAWLRRKFPKVEVHQLAVGEDEAVADFYYQPRGSGFSGLRKFAGEETTSISVRCRRLDDIVPADRPVGFMKLVVEGAEYAALRGARRILAECRPIVLFECTRFGMDAFGVSAAQVFAFLAQEMHYQISLFKDWLSDGPPLDLARFEASMVFPFQAFKYLAAPISRSRPGAPEQKP